MCIFNMEEEKTVAPKQQPPRSAKSKTISKKFKGKFVQDPEEEKKFE